MWGGFKNKGKKEKVWFHFFSIIYCRWLIISMIRVDEIIYFFFHIKMSSWGRTYPTSYFPFFFCYVFFLVSRKISISKSKTFFFPFIANNLLARFFFFLFCIRFVVDGHEIILCFVYISICELPSCYKFWFVSPKKLF